MDAGSSPPNTVSTYNPTDDHGRLSGTSSMRLLPGGLWLDLLSATFEEGDLSEGVDESTIGNDR